MYKKRLKVWDFSKRVKGAEKERVLAKILHINEPVTDEHGPIRHDKLVRYAKSRIKPGVLDSHHLRRILKRTSGTPWFPDSAT
jgi:hypothetical protein